MTKKMNALESNHGSSAPSATYINTMSRYAAIKEDEAQKCKDELLVLWTDFFKPQHLESVPNLHDTFWQAAKLCSACKVEVSEQHAQELMDAVEAIHHMFWATKGKEVPWIRAS
jgi:nickel superoxide dismutase